VGRTLRVFVSGAAIDLGEYRQAAFDACLQAGVIPIATDYLAARSEILHAAYSAIDEADIYIAVVGELHDASRPGDGCKSFTEMEYERADKKGIPCLVFVRGEDSRLSVDPRAQERGAPLSLFKSFERQPSLVTEFRSVDELRAQVSAALFAVLSGPSPKGEKSVLLLLPRNWRSENLRHLLSDMLEQSGIWVYPLDEVPGTVRTNLLTNAIDRADIVIADVTDKNPNVMYELGHAHCLRKPTIILAESTSMDSLPSDLCGNNILTYDRGNIGSIQRPLARFLQEHIKRAER
jgi:nucleoside 2-deoxyribosyltransferase